MGRQFALGLLISIAFILSVLFPLASAAPYANFSINFSNSNPHRGESILVYAQWNETVDNSTITVYSTAGPSGFTIACLSGNATGCAGGQSTWTNYSITMNTSGLLGPFNVTIYVNSTTNESSGGGSHLNATSANFTLWGWADVSESSYASSVYTTIPINLSCRVVDANTSTAIQNYSVSFYDNTGLIGYNYTNNTGWATVTYTQSNGGLYKISCNTTDNATSYYNKTSIYGKIGYLTVSPVLIVNITNLISKDGDNTIDLTNSSWVNTTFSISFANGTFLSVSSVFSYSSITNVWLVETDIPDSNYNTFQLYKNFTNGTIDTVIPGTNNWLINVSVPAGIPGGKYQVHINLTSKDGKYFGESADKNLTVSDSGLYMAPLDSISLPTITVGSDTYFNVSVKNFGPLAAIGKKIEFLKSGCTYVTITAPSDDYGPMGTCSATTTADTFIFSMPAYSSSGCWFRFKVHGDSNGACSGMYVWSVSSSGWFNNITGLSITVNPATATTTTTAPAEAANTIATTTTTTIPATTTTTTTAPLTTTAPQAVTLNVSLITPASPAIFEVIQSELLKIQRIVVAVNKNVSNASIQVMDSEKPADALNITAPGEGLVLRYLNIVPTNITDADIANVTINFQVEKIWVTENGIDEGTIALYRYSNSSWSKLPTKKVNETSELIYFQSISPGLSVFAVVGKKSMAFPWWAIFLVVSVVVAAILLFLFWPLGEKKKLVLKPLLEKKLALKPVKKIPEEGKEDVKDAWKKLREE